MNTMRSYHTKKLGLVIATAILAAAVAVRALAPAGAAGRRTQRPAATVRVRSLVSRRVRIRENAGSSSALSALSTTRRPSSPAVVRPERKEEAVGVTTTTGRRTTDRFHRQASDRVAVDAPCLLTIGEHRYNLTNWANAHPGGSAVLQKYHGRNATKAFAAVHHSKEAYELLQTFLAPQLPNDDGVTKAQPQQDLAADMVLANDVDGKKDNNAAKGDGTLGRRIRRKLFTKEDPVGVHKYLGVFCLFNFIRAYYQMYFGDPTAGLGTKSLSRHSWLYVASLLPHGLLSLSSLIFATVPKERVVKKPMIWQEFRAHNIIFGLRSVVTALVATFAVRFGHGRRIVRRLAVVGSGACVLAALAGADLATRRLRVSEVESTTATMPYWEGCSLTTQRRFKTFYAYCQFMATLACLVSTFHAQRRR
jgi:hypothetical protein